jgi:hypothetical protein
LSTNGEAVAGNGFRFRERIDEVFEVTERPRARTASTEEGRFGRGCIGGGDGEGRGLVRESDESEAWSVSD